ncbi:aromatic amino acid DMT transporter YddG [Acinetobacter ihumii]|uniref:aromatic amino acid DMT transporter YddG n=1 Tax=Acinetobacter ihumii TaxID=2483802 RepID=UPI001030EBAC|nr:aromatic amino acid DMT transporter YddG [Acinetobacter ihumii]
MKPSTANLLGLSSILIWASIVGGVKLITEQLTPLLAIALLYSVSAISMVILNRKTITFALPKTYLIVCGGCFVLYEVLFLSAIGLSHTRDEALILAMVNYLWPSFTLLFAYWFRQVSFQLAAYLGILISIFGLALVINPNVLNISLLLKTIAQNPSAYSLAFIAAILWSFYCIFTRKYAQGHNAVPLFFCLTALSLWVLFFISNQSWQQPLASLWLMIIVMGSLIGMAYKNWNQSLQFGQIQLLLLASYFTPILSSLFGSIILGIIPVWTFWLGTFLVSFGALLCWRFSKSI